jgi:alpha-tubulin suppressor-like RCC1 family protein
VWGKNDRGQLGVGSGIGIDMVESENVPALVRVADAKDQPQLVRDFTPGQNTMMIQDDELNVYKVGLKLDYSPKQVNLFGPEFQKEDVTQLACGRKHYVVLNKHNQMMVWGNVFGQKPTKEVDGFGLYFGDSLFDGGKVAQLSLKYSVYGALVQAKNA